MKKIKNVIYPFITFLFFLGLIGLYRSYFDKTSFLISFDTILRNLFNGIWLLLQSPIIQTGLLIFVGIFLIRNYLPQILSTITEIRAGEFSAKIDAKKLLSEEISREAISVSEINQSENIEENNDSLGKSLSSKQNGFDLFDKTDSNDASFVNNLFEKMPDGFCWYLMKVHAKSLSFDEHLQALEKEQLIKWDNSYQDLGYLGYLSAVFALFSDVLFVLVKDPNIKGNIRVVLKARTLELIKQKLNLD